MLFIFMATHRRFYFLVVLQELWEEERQAGKAQRPWPAAGALPIPQGFPSSAFGDAVNVWSSLQLFGNLMHLTRCDSRMSDRFMRFNAILLFDYIIIRHNLFELFVTRCIEHPIDTALSRTCVLCLCQVQSV